MRFLPRSSIILATILAGTILNTAESGETLLSLYGLPNGQTTTVLSTESDPEGAGHRVLLFGAELRLTLPVNQLLPDGTTSIGLWMTERLRNQVRFVIRDESGKRTIDAACLEGMAAGPKGLNANHAASLGAWHLRRVFLLKPAERLVLDSIEIERSAPEKELRAGPLVFSSAGSNPFVAREVWKLKDFQTPKPTSTCWTGNQFYEYGFETKPRLRPGAWRFLLPGEKPASLRLILHSMTGQPLWHTVVTGDALRQAVSLPETAEGCYLLEVAAFDTSAHLAGTTRLVYQTLRSATSRSALPEDRQAYPWSIDRLQLGGPAAQQGEPFAITVGAGALLDQHPALTLSWQVTDHAGVSHGAGRSSLHATSSRAVIALPTARAGGYKLELRFEDGQGILDEASFHYGIAGAPAPTAPTFAPLGKVTQGPILLNQLKVHHDVGLMKRLPTHTLPAISEWAFASGMSPCFLIFWGELEPVQGCYNWHLIDQYLEQAKDGKRVAIGVNFSGDTLPEWLWFEELMSQRQQTIHDDYHYVTPFGARFQKAHARLWQAILQRYRNDPRIIAWIYQIGPSEGFITDTPPKIADYNPDAVAAFQAFLSKKYGDIAKLNKVWNSRHTAFCEVRPPVPDFSKPWESSRRWWDFHLFKTAFVPEYLDRVQAAARAMDPHRPMIMYAKEGFGPSGLLGPVFRKNRFTYSNGAGESSDAFVQASLMRRFDVSVMSETGFLPPSVSSAAAVCANSILAGKFTGQMLQSGLVWPREPFPQAQEYQAVGRLMKGVSRIAGELSEAAPAVNWAGYYSATTELLQSRSMRCRLYPSIHTLLNAAQVRLNNACSWVDDATPLEILQTTPLIVDGGSKILAPDAVEKLLGYVENGGVYVCEASTGEFEPGTEAPTHRLLSRLGVKSFNVQKSAPLSVTTLEKTTLTMKRRVGIAWVTELPVRALIADAHGTPVVWERTWGKGRFLIVGGDIDWLLSSAWLGWLVDSVAGRVPYHLAGDASLCGVLRGPQADYVVIRPLLMENGKEKPHIRLADIVRSGKARVRISGIREKNTCTELIGAYRIQRTGGVIELEIPRAMLAVVRISHSP